MWFDEAVVYQIYPLGLCGAPRENDGISVPRILRVLDWVEHIRALGADTVLFNPVFQSDRHGYDTRDYFTLDCRLGGNEDLAQVCRALHDAGLRVMLDGVFNHVGRGFWAFQDVLRHRVPGLGGAQRAGRPEPGQPGGAGAPVPGHPLLGGAV